MSINESGILFSSLKGASVLISILYYPSDSLGHKVFKTLRQGCSEVPCHLHDGSKDVAFIYRIPVVLLLPTSPFLLNSDFAAPFLLFATFSMSRNRYKFATQLRSFISKKNKMLMQALCECNRYYRKFSVVKGFMSYKYKIECYV